MDSIKDKVKEKYGKVALLQESCCMPGECGCGTPPQAAEAIGYDSKELESVPQESILGAGCGAPLNFAQLREGETVVDLGSGAGIDVFLSANRVGRSGRVIGIDMTDEMLAKAKNNAEKGGGYPNVEFRRGDIEERIPLDDGTADAVISNCVINLTVDKVRAFSEVRRILRDGGRMVISDMVTDRPAALVDPEKWARCIYGALTKDDYVASIKKAGFASVTVLEERPYYVDESDGRKIASIVVKAVK